MKLRRLLSMILALVMILSMVPMVSAADDVTEVGNSADFVAAMANGGNIKLTGDIALGAVAAIPAGKTVILDLNGKTIRSTVEGNRIENAGTLTIIDSREGDKDGEIQMAPTSESAAVFALKNTGNLTINGGKITTTTKTKNAYAVYSEAPAVTINGGTFEANYNATGSFSAYAFILLGDTSGSSVATINGGTFIAKSKSTGNSRCAAVFANCTNANKITITINGGTFESERKTTRTASVVRFRDTECGATVVINGGTFSAKATAGATDDDRLFAGTQGSLTINGGTFTYDTKIFTDSRKVTLTGGTFVKWDGTQNDISGYVKIAGYTQDASGSVAQQVTSSETLIAAMAKGGSIKLAGDIALEALATVPADKTAVLDLNGKTISSTNAAYYIENAGNLTINDSREGDKDGEIIVTPESDTATVYAVKSTGVLTINGGKFTASSKAKTVYTVFSTAPSATINGGTFKATYTGGKSTWGSAHAMVLGGDGSADATATITGGTFIAESTNPENARCAPLYAYGKENPILITVKGGDFTGTRTVGRGGSALRYDDTTSNATVVIKGGTFRASMAGNEGLLNNVKGTLTVTGGTFIYDGNAIYKNSRLTVTGGTFVKFDGTKNDISTFLGEGYAQLSTGVVTKGSVTGNLVSELISYYASYQDNAATDISRVLAQLKQLDPSLGATWEKIMNYWRTVNAEGFVNVGTVPQGLPNDNSLCIVILGLKLNDDGSMQDELVGRLQTGLAIANAYPNAYVCVTGGGTAANNPNVTEAGQMAAWLLENGLSQDRLIIEDKATSTVTNAKNTYDVLVTEYQSVNNIVMVTSDYHISRGSLLYYTQFALEAQATGGKEIGIIANCGYDTDNTYETIATQASSLRTLVGATNVSVTLSVLESLTVTQDAPYVTGNDLALTVTANYNNGYSRVVDATIAGFDKTKGPEQLVTIRYTENSVTREGLFRLNQTSAQITGSGATEVNTFDAFNEAMTKGGSIRLAGKIDLSATVTVPAGVTVILDLNGQTIESNDGANVYISNAGNLTILDSSAAQTGTILSNGKSNSSSSIYALTNSGELTVEGGRIKVETKYRSCYAIYSTGKSVVINGGTMEATYASTGGAYVCSLLGFGGTNSTVTINGGKFIATSTTTHVSTRSTAIYVLKDSNVNITVNGGDFTAIREGSDGASFIRWADSTNPTITIKGGKIAVTEGDTIGMFDSKKGTLQVIGGQFLNIEGEPYDILNHLPAGYEQLDDGSVVVDDPSLPVVIELDGVKYKSLIRALKKTSAGDVLALSADVTLSDVLEVPAAVHIDLQGNTLEVPYLLAESSQITDSTQQGLLKVEKGNAIFNTGNEQLPVWDEAAGGYRMAQVKIQTKAAATTGMYYFRYDLVNADWEKLLLENLEDPENQENPLFKIHVYLYVDGVDETFEAPDNLLKQLYEDASGKGAIMVTFTGMEEKRNVHIGISYRHVEITKSTGAEPAPVISAKDTAGKVDTVTSNARTYLTAAAAKYDKLGVTGLVDANITSAKDPTNLNLYKNLQPVAFNWTLENAKFIKANIPFRIELSTSADFTDSRMIDCVHYVAGRVNQSEPVWNLMTDATYYWRVVATLANGTEVVSEAKTIQTEAGPRLIYAEGAENTRDLGGWLVSQDVILDDGSIIYRAGERTTQDRVYRSGRLETLTSAGINTIVSDLGIKTELDLRERNAGYDVLSAHGVNFVQRSDGKTCLDYTEFLKYPDRAKEALLVFADANNYPIIFNCYYGADRTGTLAFVLGALQGVSAADLVKDYELTTSRYLNRGGSLDIKAFMTGLDALEGANLYEKARTFCKSAGLTDEEIDNIVLLLSGRERTMLEPNESGVYEIRTANELQVLSNYATQGYTFQLMNDIDMGGADWKPISNFKGVFDGNGKTISNFTISKADGTKMGFIATTAKEDSNGFRTVVKNLHLDVQIIIDGTEDAVNENADVRFVGGIVGENFGNVEYCSTVCIVTDKRQLSEMKKTYYGTLVGNNAERDVDGTKVPLGIIIGTNGLEPTMNITEESKKAETKDYTVPYKKSDTKVNSKMALFLANSVDYATKTAKTQVGIAGNTNRDGINKSLLWQDLTNSTDLAAQALQERRETAAAEMYELCTVEWTPSSNMYNYYNYDGSEWKTETSVLAKDTIGEVQYDGVQRGLPYAHSATSMERFNALIGHYTGELENWNAKAYYYNTSAALALDGGTHSNQDQTEWGLYIGSDCIAQVSSAWRRICAWNKETTGAARLMVTGESFPSALYMGWYNFKPVNDLVFEIGDLNGDGKLTNADAVDNDVKYTMITEYATTNRNHYLDSFAMVSKADVLIGYSAAGNGHALMALSDAVVIRNYAGTVDANKSFIITAEQGGTGADSDGIDRYSYSTTETVNLGFFSITYTTYHWRSTCAVDRKYSFAALLQDSGAAGATGWKYFPITCDVLRNVDSAAATATISMDASGKVTSNFHIISTTVNGETVFTNMEPAMTAYRGAKTAVTLTDVHSTAIEAGAIVTIQLSNGKTYTGVYGTAGLTEAN